MRRRLEIKLDSPELLVVDDYAHHPSEVEAGLAALKGARKLTTVVYQPHRFSRTALMADELPIHAYTDPGFDAWLKTTSHEEQQ